MSKIAKSPAKGSHKPAASDKLKRMFKRAKTNNSFKQFVSELPDDKYQDLKNDWFHNKKVNTSKPGLGIGNTHKKKGK